MEYKISTLNNISSKGLDLIKGDFKLQESLDGSDAIIVRSYKMHDMKMPDGLLAIGRAGAGVNNIPVEDCTAQGIVVFNAPGANANAVKELTISAMIMAARNIYEGVYWGQSLSGDVASEVEAGKKQFAGTEIEGKTLGIIGLGAIGAKLANACEALGMNIAGYEAMKPHPSLKANVTMYDSSESMVPECDFISIHVPSLPSTKGMINQNLISKMKDGAIVLNFARPDLVVPGDIIKALESGKIRKYMTDLLEPEYIGVPGIVATPHLGASTAEAEENCAVMVINQVMDYLKNGNIVNSVNFPRVSLDRASGSKRHCILIKCDKDIGEIKSKIQEFYGDSLVQIAAAQKGVASYVIADVLPDCQGIFACDCVAFSREII